MRKASINFQPVSRVEFAASHAHRTELHEPAYLLPKQHRLANFTVSGSVSEVELVERFHAKKNGDVGPRTGARIVAVLGGSDGLAAGKR